MLAGSGRLPVCGASAYEVKWDGFRTRSSRPRDRCASAFVEDGEEGDVLRHVPAKPSRDRRRTLKGLGLNAPEWRVPEAFEDGPALWEAVCEHELEGVFAKRLHEPYLCGERAWVTVKNRDIRRYEIERDAAIRGRQRAALKRRSRRPPSGSKERCSP